MNKRKIEITEQITRYPREGGMDCYRNWRLMCYDEYGNFLFLGYHASFEEVIQRLNCLDWNKLEHSWRRNFSCD